MMPKTRYRVPSLAVAGALLVGVCACISPPPPHAPPALTAAPSPAMKRLRVTVGSVNVEGELGRGFDAEFRKALPAKLAAAFSRAGYQDAGGAAHDVLVNVKVRVDYKMGDFAGWPKSVADVTFRTAGGGLHHATVTVPPEADVGIDGPGGVVHAERLAILVANELAQNGQVVALASSLYGAAPDDSNAVVAVVPRPTASVGPGAVPVRSGTPQPTAYALVVGIEKYRDLPAPPGARADAEAFAQVVKKTLGLPESNVHLALDDHATHTDLVRELAWLEANVPPNGRVYFFFSGHGAPDPSSGTPYLMPYDGDAQTTSTTGVPVADVIGALGKTKAKETLAFVDACFSGAGGRSVLPKGARPLVHVVEPKAQGGVALFSSSSGSEISGPAQDGKQGAFTKYVVEALGAGKGDADGDGQITLRELVDYVTPRVSREAQAQSRAQTPSLVLAPGAGDPKGVPVVWGIK